MTKYPVVHEFKSLLLKNKILKKFSTIHFIKKTLDKFSPKFDNIRPENIQKAIQQLYGLLRTIPKLEATNLNINEKKILLKEFSNICILAENLQKQSQN